MKYYNNMIFFQVSNSHYDVRQMSRNTMRCRVRNIVIFITIATTRYVQTQPESINPPQSNKF